MSLCCHYAESRYAKCHYAECRFAECRGAHKTIRIIQFRNKLRVYCTKFTALLDTFFRFVKKNLGNTIVYQKMRNIFYSVSGNTKKNVFQSFFFFQ